MALLEDALDLLLPGVCCFCGDGSRQTPSICDPCAGALPRNLVCCPRCANPLPTRGLCPECLRNRHCFGSTISPFLYTDAARELVSSAKFLRDLSAVACIGHLLARHIASVSDCLPDVVIPVPLHATRLRQRGYNQALEMSKVISRYVPIKINGQVCRRIRSTAAQSSLDGLAERRRNVRRAFVIDEVPAGAEHVALVDDVMTAIIP